MLVRKAVLKSFDPPSYTAVIQIDGSYKSYLVGIAVARNLPAAELVPGRALVVVLFTADNPADAVVIAVYSG